MVVPPRLGEHHWFTRPGTPGSARDTRVGPAKAASAASIAASSRVRRSADADARPTEPGRRRPRALICAMSASVKKTPFTA